MVSNSGTDFTITRRASSQGGSQTTRTVRLIPQSLANKDTSALYVEGLMNSAGDQPHMFVANYNADIQAGDTLKFNSMLYHLDQPQYIYEGGIAVSAHAVGRVRAVAFT